MSNERETPTSITALFRDNAAPEAINARLEKARGRLKQWERHVRALESLLETRTVEKAAGTWPTKEAGGV